MLNWTIRNDAQHGITTLLRHCFEWLQHCSNNATLRWAENRSYGESRVGDVTRYDDTPTPPPPSGLDPALSMQASSSSQYTAEYTVQEAAFSLKH